MPEELISPALWSAPENKGSPRVRVTCREPSLVESFEVVWENGQPATSTAIELLGALLDLAEAREVERP